MFKGQQTYSRAGRISTHSPIHTQLPLQRQEIPAATGTIGSPVILATTMTIGLKVAGKALNNRQKMLMQCRHELAAVVRQRQHYFKIARLVRLCVRRLERDGRSYVKAEREQYIASIPRTSLGSKTHIDVCAQYAKKRQSKSQNPLKNQGFQRVLEKAGDKTRTCDRLITNQLLYQLSYTSNGFQYSNRDRARPYCFREPSGLARCGYGVRFCPAYC